MMPETLTPEREAVTAPGVDVALYSPDRDTGTVVESLGSYSVQGWGVEE